MATIAIRNFQGEIPRLPAHLLPDGAAQLAVNCDFSNGQLTPAKGGLDTGLSTSNTISSLFTDNGITWWATDTDDIRFYKSPVIDDTNGRGYFLWSDGRVKVDIIPTSGGTFQSPNTSTNVGVPQPTVAPVLTVTTLGYIPGLTSAAWTFSYWYESNGVRYQETQISNISTVTANQEWTFTPAAIDTGTAEAPKTPEGSALVVQAVLKDGSKEIFKLNTSTAATVGARTSALPGGVEFSASKNTTTNLVTVKAVWGPVDTRAYCYTVKNTWGEESAPSPAELISPTYIQQVNIQITVPSFSGYRAQAAGTSGVGIYRTFGGSSEYLSVAVTSSSSTLFVDAVHTPANVGTLLKSSNWTPPPLVLSSGVGMHLTPNGWFIAAKGNTLYMSEPYRPHAWPYSITLPRAVRGICVGPQNIVVTTFEATYVINGPHPASVMQQKLPVPIGGVSSRSMCATENGVAMATNDGIVFINGTSASLSEGQRLFTRTDWNNYYGSVLGNLRLVYFGGRLIGGSPFPDSKGSYGFVIRTDEGQAAGNFSRSSVAIRAASVFQTGDALYFSSPNDGLSPSARKLFSYGGGDNLSADWWSKEYIFPQPERMGALYIRTAGNCTVTIYRDGVQLKDVAGNNFTISATSSTQYYRLPAVGPGLRWSIKLSGFASAVYEVVMGHTIEDLKRA